MKLITFTPWQTAKVLERLPELKIGADYSHWCVACERMPDVEDDDVKLAMKRSIHIHGRVGYSEGPQVPDPRVPEYEKFVETFINYWFTICQHRLESGAPYMTFTPEFGPPPYLHTLPFTRQPVADLWEVNLWMYKKFEQRYMETILQKKNNPS